MRQSSRFILLLLISAVLAGCGSQPRSPQMQATVDAISTAAVATISVRMLGEPASTAVPLDGGGSTVDPDPQAAQVDNPLSQSNETQAAAFAPFLPELSGYQVDIDRGRPGWLHPPLTLDAQGPNGVKFANQFASTTAADFALAADIRWQANAEQTGCGFLLRSDGNQASPSQYLLGLTRFGGGRIYFSVMAEGETISEQEINPSGVDPRFSIADGASNRLAVVARGVRFQIYSNGVFVGEFDPNQPPERPVLPPPPPEPEDRSDPLLLSAYLAAKKQYDEATNQTLANYNARLRAFQAAEREFERGFTAMGALAQQGGISCTFENAWLWHIDG